MKTSSWLDVGLKMAKARGIEQPRHGRAGDLEY